MYFWIESSQNCRAMSHAPEPYYLAFIDEAGDPGLNTVRPIDAAGGKEWLCLGAVVIRAARSSDVSEWVHSILLKAGGSNHSDLHYRNLPNFRRRLVCSELAKLPVRAFVLASNKKNMRRYRNPRAERIGSQVVRTNVPHIGRICAVMCWGFRTTG